ncbi:MAG: serine/threonine protein kinase, partial [Planctomycetota bacterium]
MVVDKDSNNTPGFPEDPLEAAMFEFREAYISGTPPDPDEFCKNHPECGPDLRRAIDDFLAMMAGLQKVFHRKSSEKKDIYEGKVFGDFRVIKTIGRGGMGVVCMAEQISLKRKVALKLLRGDFTDNPRFITRFQREPAAAGALNHPVIAPVHAVGEKDGIHYFAMEFVEGEGLDTLLSRIRNQNPQQILGMRAEELVLHDARYAKIKEQTDNPSRSSILGQSYLRWILEVIEKVADALHHAYESGIIHRDIKPSNILIRKDGQPFLVDFGLAFQKEITPLTVPGEFMGTYSYVSPEQARAREPLDHRTDVYSLGVTLYELLTLRVPFPGENTQEILFKTLHREPLSPKKLNPAIPKDVETIILKAMEKERERRYDTAGDMAGDLQAFSEDRPINAEPSGMATKTMKFVKRNKHLVGGLAAGLFIALIVLFCAILWRLEVVESSKEEAEENLRKGALDLLAKVRPTIEGTMSELGFSDLLKAYSKYPHHSEVIDEMINLGSTLRKKGLVGAAEYLFENVLLTNDPPQHKVAIHEELANCKFHFLDLEQARNHLGKAVSLLKSDPGRESRIRFKQKIIDFMQPGPCKLPISDAYPADGERLEGAEAVISIDTGQDGSRIITFSRDSNNFVKIHQWWLNDDHKFMNKMIPLYGTILNKPFKGSSALQVVRFTENRASLILIANEDNQDGPGHIWAWNWDAYNDDFKPLWKKPLIYDAHVIRILHCADFDEDGMCEFVVVCGPYNRVLRYVDNPEDGNSKFEGGDRFLHDKF